MYQSLVSKSSLFVLTMALIHLVVICKLLFPKPNEGLPDNVLVASQVIFVVNLIFLIWGFITLYKLLYIYKGRSTGNTKVRIISEETNNMVSLFVTVFSAFLIDFESIGEIISFIIAYIFLWLVYVKTNLYASSNIILTLFGYRYYKVKIEEQTGERDVNTLYKGEMKDECQLNYISLPDKSLYVMFE